VAQWFGSMETPRYTTTLIKKETPARDILVLQFKKSDGFIFQAGQFVQFEIPVPGGAPVLRPYSISSAPADIYLEFCVKLVPKGIASHHFNHMALGDEITFQGPRGFFVVKEQVSSFYIATGAGIAPIMGMIRDELENKNSSQPIHVLFGVRCEEDIFWAERCEKLKKKFSNFTFQITLSQPSAMWKGRKGRVSAHLPGAVTGKHYFICGGAEMVKDVRAYLLARGVPMPYVHIEIF